MIDLQKFIEDPPVIHGGGTSTVHHISRRTIDVLNDIAKPDLHTIETGIGFSTLVFTLNQCSHISIAPVLQEKQDLIDYFIKYDINYDSTSFMTEKSEFVLPKLIDRKSEIDIVFIDGRHAFPTPFIDFYYLSLILTKGGILFIDDIHIWTGKILYDFLLQDDRWSLIKNIVGRTAIFEKKEVVEHSEWWGQQPFVVSKSKKNLWKSKIRQLGDAVLRGDFHKITRKLNRYLNK